METMKEKMQTLIPSPTRSHSKALSSDKTLSQESMKTVSPSNATRSRAQHKTRRISKKYSHIPGVIHRMCRHQGYMIQRMENKYVTEREFWKVHGKVDKVLHEIVPHIAEKATNDSIEEFADQAPQIIEELFKSYVANNVIQVYPTASTFTATNSDDAFRPQHHDDHQDDDAPPEGEKRVKRQKISKSSKSTRSSSSTQPATTYVFECQ
ncbi:hypothetical protein Tco_0304567 [Tanacetum coccineum]